MKLYFGGTWEQNIVRAVADMAGYFDCQLVAQEAAEAELRLSLADGVARAVFVRGAGYKLAQEAFAEAVSGEIARAVKLAVVRVLAQALRKEAELPWGVLTGVRPGKLAHKLIGELGDNPYGELPSLMERRYLLPTSKGQMLANICLLQDRIAPLDEVGVYIGIPYCPSRCSYCSFPAGLIPKSEEIQEKFVNCIEQDIKSVVYLLGDLNLKVSSVYVGGGTPTSLSEVSFARLMGWVKEHLLLPTVREFTVEAGRPDCFTAGKLKAMEGAGVNRISVNPQTFNDRTLKAIGRAHTVKDFYDAYALVRASKIPVINMDLIIGLPGESYEDVCYSLEKAIELRPENLTVHTLTLKRNSPLYQEKANLAVKTYLTATEAEQLVALAEQMAAEAGLKPYYLYRQHYMLGHLANIGYALPGTESLYNIQMMEERHSIIAIGPCSSSKKPHRDGHHIDSFHMPKNIDLYQQNLAEYCAKRLALFRRKD